MAKKTKKKICQYCEKNEIEDGFFRCDECSEKAIMDPTKKATSAATIRWKQPGGGFTPRP